MIVFIIVNTTLSTIVIVKISLLLSPSIGRDLYTLDCIARMALSNMGSAEVYRCIK